MKMFRCVFRMDIGVFFQNLAEQMKEWGGYFIIFLGVVMVIWAAVLIAKGLMTHGSGRPTNWLMIGALLLVGGLMIASGFEGIYNFAKMGEETLKGLAGG